MKKILALAMAALMIFCLFACAKEKEESGEEENTSLVGETNVIKGADGTGTFECDQNDDGDYVIKKYSPASVSLVDLELPSTTSEGYDIVGIAPDAFKAKNSIKSVKIPDTYVTIGKYAFYDCDGLTTVTMANSVTTIGEGAFQNCDKLATVTMSTAITTVETRAFANCIALTAADLSTSVVSIQEAAFIGCSALTSVTISDKVEFVERNAFNDCTSLTYTEFDNAKYLGNTANPHLVLARVNDNAKACVINAATKVVATNAFSDSKYLETVTVTSTSAEATVLNLKFIDAECFNNTPALKYNEYENAYYLGTETNPYAILISVIIPSASNLTVHPDTAIITESAFANCASLTDINYTSKTEADWQKITKIGEWKHDRSMVIYLSDSKNIPA